MRYLITGGAGFIGAHLTASLLADGHRVVALDDLSTGDAANVAGADAGAGERFRLVTGSVLDEDLVNALAADCDAIVHLAAAVGVRLIVDQALSSLTTNVRGTDVVLAAADRHRRPVLLASTSEVYGRSQDIPLREDADSVLGSPALARWSYAAAKAVDECLAHAYHRERGLPVVVVRLFNTVGPRQSAAYGMVIPRLVRQALAGEPLTVYGDGRQTRCFLHVADAVAALRLLLAEPRAVGGTFNLGSSHEVTILGLAHRILDLTGSRSEITLLPLEQVYGGQSQEPRRRVPDTGRLRALTGWRPARSLDDVLRDVIAQTARAASAGAVD